MQPSPADTGAPAPGPAPDRAGAPSARPRPAVTATHLAVAAVGAYVGAQVVANVTSVKIGSTFGRAVDMGPFVYPITFTLRTSSTRRSASGWPRSSSPRGSTCSWPPTQWVAACAPSYGLDEEFRRCSARGGSSSPRSSPRWSPS